MMVMAVVVVGLGQWRRMLVLPNDGRRHHHLRGHRMRLILLRLMSETVMHWMNGRLLLTRMVMMMMVVVMRMLLLLLLLVM